MITGLAGGEGGGGNRAESSSSTEQANGTSVSAPCVTHAALLSTAIFSVSDSTSTNGMSVFGMSYSCVNMLSAHWSQNRTGPGNNFTVHVHIKRPVILTIITSALLFLLLLFLTLYTYLECFMYPLIKSGV